MCKTIQIKYCPYITLLKELLGSMKCEVYKHFTPSGVKTGCAIFRARAVFHLAYERSASDLHLFRFLRGAAAELRSEEHTSELQSRRDIVCRLLLEKKTNCSYST